MERIWDGENMGILKVDVEHFPWIFSEYNWLDVLTWQKFS